MGSSGTAFNWRKGGQFTVLKVFKQLSFVLVKVG
jgi:hypothetical protein